MLAAYFIIVCVFGDVGAVSLYLVIIWVLLCFSSCRTQKACMIIKKSFPLVQKFKLFGVKMGNGIDRKSTRLNSSHLRTSRMPSSA